MASRHTSGDLFALGAAGCSAAAYLVATEAVQLMEPLVLGTVEFALALPAVLLWAWLRGTLRQLGTIGRRDLLLIVAQSMLTVAAIALLWIALRLVPTTTAAILGRLEVVLAVVLGSLLLRDRLPRLALAGGALSFVGVVVMRWEAPPELEAGSLLVMGSALAFALAEVLSTILARRVRPSLFLLARTPIVTAMFAVALGVQTATGPSPPAPGPRAIGMAALLALFGPILARVLYFAALSRTTLSRAALVNQSQPLIVALLVLGVHGRWPSSREALGGLLVLVGTFVLVGARPLAAIDPVEASP